MPNNEEGGIMTFDITERCRDFFNMDGADDLDDPTSMNYCILNEPVLQPFIDLGGFGILIAMDKGQESSEDRSNHSMCTLQHDVCHATEKYQNLESDCSQARNNCQVALRHLYEMMFVNPVASDGNYNDKDQICNNFARKSIRGFFHDYMSKGIEGSILDEHDVHMNFGLCRWTQYINVLSDHTQCDPGSIIAMAGQLGYVACGVDIYNLDDDVKPSVIVNRPYPCSSNLESSPLFDATTKQRKEQFSDAQLASNSTAMEEFWYEANKHTHGRPDGEAEYSGEAAAAGHAIGRVTCPPDGVTKTGSKPNYKLGFFTKQPSAEDLESDPMYDELYWAVGTTNVNRQYQYSLNRLSDTQCFVEDDNYTPQPEGVRPSTVDGETDFNSEGGLCGMPTQFLTTVRIGSSHRVPRWLTIVDHSSPEWPSYSEYQSACRQDIPIYLPTELLTLSNIALPTTDALNRFLDIAWDGYDRIDSEWDSCVVGCSNPIADNRLCGGNGIQDFNWVSSSDCKENPKSKFVRKIKYDSEGEIEKVVKKSCRWLQQQDNPNEYCEKDLQDGDIGSAADNCPITCSKCVPTSPPSSSCEEDPNGKFVKAIKYDSEGEEIEKVVKKTCNWLQNQDNSNKHCKKNLEYKKFGSASSVCPITCKSCT